SGEGPYKNMSMTPPLDKASWYLDQVSHLPPAPTVVFELLRLFKETECGINRAVELIGRDPALTAEVLKLANSAAFSTEHKVEGVFDAVMRIGFCEAYRVVVAISASKVMSKLIGAAGGFLPG